MANVTTLQVSEFLRKYPRMRVKPRNDSEIHFEGWFDFTANSEHGTITDSYRLHITLPETFPWDSPNVYELDFRVPRMGSYHVNNDGSFCLGSRLRLLRSLSGNGSLLGFADRYLIPYLFAVSHKLQFGGRFLFGELPHGLPGELVDYAEVFGLKTIDQARMTIRYLGMKKRRANKMVCPCGCNTRLGRCQFNWRVRSFRRLAERRWFRLILG